MAYQSLSPSQQAVLGNLLSHHPEAATWREEFRADTGLSLGEYFFMRASVWPDEIRSRNGAGYKTWLHYTNYPLRPPDFPLEETLTPDNDVLDGIDAALEGLNGNGDKRARAISLAWLLHLVGDLHQPLHTTALVTDVYPEGDRGGNDFYVMPRARGIRLHAYWDGVLGRDSNLRKARQGAERHAAIEHGAVVPAAVVPVQVVGQGTLLPVRHPPVGLTR